MLKNVETYKGKNVLVCGLARSGLSVAKLLKNLGADVTISDLKTESNLSKEVENYGIKLYLGRNPDEIIHNFDITVLSPGIPADLPVFSNFLRGNKPLIGEIEVAASVCANKIAAVTGTNGKTTTTTLLGEMINSHFMGSVTVGNIGVPFSDKVSGVPFGAWVTAELSSYQLETTRTLKPAVAVILNITPDHLARHGTLENYSKMKEKIFMNQDENDFTILNFDCEICRNIKPTNSKVLYFSRLGKFFEDGTYVREGKIFLTLDKKEHYVCEKTDIKIVGEHNVENVLAATAMAFCANVPLETIRQTIQNFTGVEHRIEHVREIDGISFYNDSKATNPDSAIKAVESFTKPLIIIAGGSEKNSDYTEWLDICRKNGVKKIVLIGVTAQNIASTCDKIGYKNYLFAKSLQEAVETSLNLAEKGDVVLLSPACASFDMFEDFEERGRIFKEIVNKL